MIEAITQDEFETAGPPQGRRLSAESRAVQALKPLTGIKMPCRWKHHQGHACSGGNGFTRIARRRSMTISATCQDGVVYVFRYE